MSEVLAGKKMKEVDLPTIYSEILNLKEKVGRIENILIPEEEVSEKELGELKARRKEVLKGKYTTLEALTKRR